MDTARSFPFRSIANLSSPLGRVIPASLVFILCYQGARLAFVLGVPPDQTASFWPPTAILIAVLLLVPRRIWPPVIAAGVVAMTLADLRDGVPIRFEIWLTLGCITEVTIAMLGISLLFRGAPQLTTAKALVKYLVVGVILAPLVAGLVGAIPSVPSGYWVQWRLWFFGDALAFLTLTPAILTWCRAGRAWAHKPENFLELACLMSLLGLFGYFTFIAAGQRGQPALLYSLVPLLLWAALRLGLKGVSTSIVVAALLSVWGAAHGRGPFAQQGALTSVLSLQLYLFFAALPFMFLAVLVEEQKHAEGALRKSEEKFSKAFRESPIALSLSSVKDHRYIEVNETFERRTGWRRDEVIGRTPLDIGLWKDFVQRDDFQRRLLNEGCVRNFEISSRTKNGEVRTGLGSAELIEIDGQPCALTAVADITDLKQAEAALRESEARFRLVANTAPVMIWMTGVDKLCTYVNQPCVEFTEQPAEALVGSGWTQGIHSDDLAQSWDTYSEAFDQHKPFRTEYRFRRHDGEYRWILASGVPRFDADGSFVGYIGSAIDVTDRKLAERGLALANERLRMAMESGKSTGWDRDIKNGRDTWFGDLQSMFGIPSDTYEGTLEDFLDRQLYPEDRVRVVEEAKNAMENKKPYASEYRILGPDGAVRWVAVKGKFFYSAKGEPERMVGMKVDITERKLMEVALRESEERLRLAAQAGKMYAFEWDASTDVITRSEEVTHIPGLVGAPARLTKKELLAEVHPEDRARFVNSIAELTVERPKCQASFRVLRSDGSVRWLERTGHAFFDKQGKMVRMIGMVADITERKLAEEALSTVSQKLIEAQEQERSRLARELHDDINQRLAMICVTLQRLKQDLPSSEVRFRGRIRKAWQSATDLANDIQNLSHQLHSPKLEILGLASAAAGFCRELSDQKAVEIEFHSENVQRELPQEVSLPLFRVLQEALQNAIKHSGSKRIRVLLKQEGSEVELAVNDAGVGFELEEAIKGKGLGLISMIERLKMARGRLSIDSAPQHGTTLHARVPIIPRTKSEGTAGLDTTSEF